MADSTNNNGKKPSKISEVWEGVKAYPKSVKDDFTKSSTALKVTKVAVPVVTLVTGVLVGNKLVPGKKAPKSAKATVAPKAN